MYSRRQAALLAALSLLLPGCSGLRSLNPFAKSQQPKTPDNMAIQEEVKLSKRKKEKPTAPMLTDFGHVNLALDRHQAAAEFFDRAIELDKKYAPAYVGRAQLYSRQGNSQQAMQTLHAGLEKAPEAPEIWNELGMMSSERGEHAAALQAMEKALKNQSDPEKYKAYGENYGWVLANAGMYEDSYKWYCRTIPPADAYYRLAEAQLRRGERDAGVRHLELALQSDPRHQAASKRYTELQRDPLMPVGYQTPIATRPMDGYQR